MKLSKTKLHKIIKEEIHEVFSSSQKNHVAQKLKKKLKSEGFSVNNLEYGQGYFSVGDSGFLVDIVDIFDGINKDRIGILVEIPELQSYTGVTKRKIWGKNIKEIFKKLKVVYNDGKNDWSTSTNKMDGMDVVRRTRVV